MLSDRLRALRLIASVRSDNCCVVLLNGEGEPFYLPEGNISRKNRRMWDELYDEVRAVLTEGEGCDDTPVPEDVREWYEAQTSVSKEFTLYTARNLRAMKGGELADWIRQACHTRQTMEREKLGDVTGGQTCNRSPRV